MADADAPVRADVDVPPPPSVQVIDSPLTRVHRLTDLISMIVAVLGIGLTLLISAYAQATAEGVTEDIQRISSIVQQLLVAPVRILSGIITIVIPAYIIISLAVRKEPRRILEVIGASIIGFALTGVAALLLLNFGSEPLLASLSVPNLRGHRRAPAACLHLGCRGDGHGVRNQAGKPDHVAVVDLAVGGRRSGRRDRHRHRSRRHPHHPHRPASRASPCATPLAPTPTERMATRLVEGITRAGFAPRRIVRADATDDYTPESLDGVTAALARSRAGRVYAVTTKNNHKLIAVAIDGDQNAAGFLSKLWSTVRLRGVNARADVSLRQSAERTALVSHAARTAGVRTSRVLGMASARDTFITVYQRPLASRSFGDTAPDDISDLLLDSLWNEAERAHVANISHRNISSETVLVADAKDGEDPAVWLTTWELGETAASDLAIRIDRAQVLAMIATKVGVDRAVESAFRCLTREQVEQFAPLLQSVALPRTTRGELKAARPGKVLEGLREGILAKLPDADVETENITRFGGRTVITFVLAAVAIFVIAGFKTQDLLDALRDANLWWLLVAFIWSVLTYIGATLVLIGFSPVKLPWMRAFLAQVAATYVALAAPAGVGPAALNMRLLSKRGVPAPLGVATVALIQVSSVVVTVTGLVTLTLTSGSQQTLASLPSTAILIGVGVSIAVLALALLVPRVRKFAVAKVMPVIRQTWPRLSQVLGQPWRLGLGLGGNLLMTVGYVGAFYASLEAFGQSVAIIDLTIAFFLGSAVGAIIPTPGGVGPVELALTAALTTTVGVPYGIAFSAVIIYRFITHFMNIPLGLVAMKYLERKGDV